MNKVIIFGAGKIAEVIAYYFRNESDRTVAAFTVDRPFVKADTFDGLPLVPFDEIAQKYPPATHDMFVALGYQDMNRLRATKVREAKEKGYRLISYVNPDAGIPRDAVVGENCFIMRNALIHPRVRIGDNVFVWSGAMIGHHSVIGDHCWITSCANIAGAVTVGSNCFFAVNATVAHQVKIGNDCFIGANALVTRDVKDEQVLIAENTKPFRLNSRQFLAFSRFSDL